MAADSKTEKATPKKRRDERKEGNVFQSSDVVNVVCVLGIFYSLKLLLPGIFAETGAFMRKYVSFAGDTDSMGGFAAIPGQFALVMVKAALPILLISAALAMLATGAQTRFLFSAKKVRPKLSNISPLQGIRKMFSLKSLVELVKNILKVIILAVLLYMALKGDFVQVMRTMDMDLGVSVAFVLNLALQMILKVVMVFAFIAALDYFYQWWEYERQIRMSKQELKEEYKQTEGNPEIKGKIKEMQRQRARSRMMQAVPGADVIIRNPTHFAVALRYDPQKDQAPRVLAKGQDELALRIVQVGEENGVVIIENKPLARGLYASAVLDREIPQEYYAAVAEILVYVYRLKNKVEDQG